MIINCIGDSHASFFSGFDCIIPEWPQNGNCYFKNIKAYRIGPVLAYSLHKRWHKGGRLLFKIEDKCHHRFDSKPETPV